MSVGQLENDSHKETTMTTTHKASAPVFDAAALASLLNFGGKGGGFSAIGDVGGQQILFWSGQQIDAIQIGDNKYGGGGGGLNATAQIPADGKVYIIELQATDSVLCYIKMKIGETEVAVGNNNHGEAIVLAAPNLAVRFAGISHGQRVDRLYFNLVT
jgi:hypothetical protein